MDQGDLSFYVNRMKTDAITLTNLTAEFNHYLWFREEESKLYDSIVDKLVSHGYSYQDAVLAANHLPVSTK